MEGVLPRLANRFDRPTASIRVFCRGIEYVEQKSGTRRTACLHDSKTVCSGESGRWKLRKNSGWLISVFSFVEAGLSQRR